MTRRMLQAVWVATVCGALMTGGCTISKQGSGEDKKISIEAPGASVRVDTGVGANDSGIAAYPGAQEKHGKDDDQCRAHVNVSTPFLKLKVVKMTFTSNDAPEKILAFYRNKLGNYGTVLECKDTGQDVEIGSGSGLDSPVTCGKDRAHGANVNLGGETSLKVGTEGNQHLVTVKPSGNGSEFELVWVYLGNARSDDDYGGKQPS